MEERGKREKGRRQKEEGRRQRRYAWDKCN